MGMSETTLRVVVGIVGGLLIVTRLWGVIDPRKIRGIGERMKGMKPGWVRFIYIICGLLGLWILYSTLVIIFHQIPVFMVISLLIGLIFLLSGMFIIHPEWFPRLLKNLLVDRGDFFIRFACFLGVLGGVFFLLTAIFGSSWGGGG